MSEKPIKKVEEFFVIDGEEVEGNIYCCYGHESIFGEWEDIPQEHKNIISALGGLKCEGYGNPSGECWRCYYNQPRGYGEIDETADRNAG